MGFYGTDQSMASFEQDEDRQTFARALGGSCNTSKESATSLRGLRDAGYGWLQYLDLRKVTLRRIDTAVAAFARPFIETDAFRRVSRKKVERYPIGAIGVASHSVLR